jgi:hypothetical protein
MHSIIRPPTIVGAAFLFEQVPVMIAYYVRKRSFLYRAGHIREMEKSFVTLYSQVFEQMGAKKQNQEPTKRHSPF